MPAPTVKIQKDEDGGYSLVGTVQGVTLKFATVNPSYAAEEAAKQGKTWKHEATDDDGENEG